MDMVHTYLDFPLPLSLPPKLSPPVMSNTSHLNFPIKKSPGYDLITLEILEKLPEKLIVHITHIFNLMLRLSYFPILRKFSTIILILKPAKSPDTPTSYRPIISLLPILSKVFEKLLLKRLLSIVHDTNILPNSQFGFRNNHNTIYQIHHLVDKISFSLEEKHYCTGMFLDVAQAFDRIWHAGLLLKLKSLFPPDYYLILKSYLENRFFTVRSSAESSLSYEIKTGVPQGAVFAPFLFNIYISDQPSTPSTIVDDFADDKKNIIIIFFLSPLIIFSN